MNLVIKPFDELTTKELYEILKVRTEIFVVEQNCIYQDMDYIDYKSLHLFFKEGEKVVAYLRIFYPNEDKNTIHIGRVLTLKHGIGLGRKILEAGVKAVKERTVAKKISLEAQTYAIGYYGKLGFEVTSDEFILDGIPHVTMELNL